MQHPLHFTHKGDLAPLPSPYSSHSLYPSSLHPDPEHDIDSTSSPTSTTSDPPPPYYDPEHAVVKPENSPIPPSGSSSDSQNASSPDPPPKKRASRRTWNHALEKLIFSPHEIATLGAPHRRTIYLASLEAHIDRLHSQLLQHNLYPVHVDALQPYKGLNCKTAKGMVAGLQHDIVAVNRALLDADRAINNLTNEYEAARADRLLRLHQLQTAQAETSSPPPSSSSSKQESETFAAHNQANTQAWINAQATAADGAQMQGQQQQHSAREWHPLPPQHPSQSLILQTQRKYSLDSSIAMHQHHAASVHGHPARRFE